MQTGANLVQDPTSSRKHSIETARPSTKTPKPTHQARKARRATAPYQDTGALGDHIAQLRGAQVPDPRRQELPGYHHHGRHGRAQAWGIRAVRLKEMHCELELTQRG